MDVFPTQYSTLSTLALKGYIEKQYGFKALKGRLLMRNVSDTYIFEDHASKYIFKVYRTSYRTLEEIRGEVELLNILKEKGVKCAYPIRDPEGRQIQQFQAAEGMRCGVLFTFAPGRVVIDLNDRQLRVVGREMALLHRISSDIVLPYKRVVYDVHTTLERPLEIIRHRFREMPEEYAYLRETAEKTIERLRQFDLSKFGYGYCHYDLLPKNFHFDEDDRITFFDFDWMGKGWLVNDLMTFFVQLFWLVSVDRITQEEADRQFKIFLEAYQEERKISAQELEAIPCLGFMFWIHGFGFFEDNFDDFSISFLTARFIKDRVALIKKWVDWYYKAPASTRT